MFNLFKRTPAPAETAPVVAPETPAIPAPAPTVPPIPEPVAAAQAVFEPHIDVLARWRSFQELYQTSKEFAAAFEAAQNFTDKESYLTWRAHWKALYARMTDDAQHPRLEDRIGVGRWNPVTKDYPRIPYKARITRWGRDERWAMNVVLKAGKEKSWRLRCERVAQETK